MIRFRDTLNRSSAPPWLIGAHNLHRKPSRDGELWACGDAFYLTDAGPWRELGDGYEVAGPIDAFQDYRRADSWFSVCQAYDMHGNAWDIPKILDAAGNRVFRVSYGRDFMPELSAEQYRILEVAKAAKDAIAASTDGVQDVGVQAACRWAAELLTVSYHLPIEAIAELCIMDDDLAVGALSIAISLTCAVQT
jgi:hypothetical protein